MSRFGLGFVGASGIPGNDSFVKSLLHFDGAQGDTSTIDVNGAGLSNTWTFETGTFIDTSIPKFGSGAFQNGSSTGLAYLGVNTPYRTDFDVGSSDFTVDCQVNFNGFISNSRKGIAEYANAKTGSDTQGPWGIYTKPNTYPYVVGCYVYDGTTTTEVFGTIPISATDGYHHIELVRNGSSFKTYIDGVVDLSFTRSGNLRTPSASTGLLRVGWANGGTSQTSFFDEFRYSVGIARHTANFTPPGAPYI